MCMIWTKSTDQLSNSKLYLDPTADTKRKFLQTTKKKICEIFMQALQNDISRNRDDILTF